MNLIFFSPVRTECVGDAADVFELFFSKLSFSAGHFSGDFFTSNDDDWQGVPKY